MIRLFFGLVLVAAAWGQEPYKIGNGVSAPVPIFRVSPEYAQEARDAGIDGTVFLSAVIDAEGMPTEVRAVRFTLKEKRSGREVGTDFGLKEKAREAVAKWRFKPGMKGGKPVAVQLSFEMTFRKL